MTTKEAYRTPRDVRPKHVIPPLVSLGVLAFAELSELLHLAQAWHALL